MLAVAIIWCNLSGNNINGKIFDAELLIRTSPTNLLLIFCKNNLNPKVIFKVSLNQMINS